MNPQLFKTLGVSVAALVILSACSGAGTTGSTNSTASADTQTLTGTISSTTASSSDVAFLKQNNDLDSLFNETGTETQTQAQENEFDTVDTTETASTECRVDQIVATDTAGATVTATLDSACSFELPLPIGQSYNIGFVKEGLFVANLMFDTGMGGLMGSSVSPTNAGETIPLGQVVISGSMAVPEFNPLASTDLDQDGLMDEIDLDDDDDGIFDEDEFDCDLDGFVDDYDSDISDCDDDELQGRRPGGSDNQVSRAWPPREGRGADLELGVEVQFSCDIDPASVNDDVMALIDEAGNDLGCEVELSETDGIESVVCDPQNMEDLADQIFQVQVDGLLCQDGSAVESVSWEFATGACDEEFDDDDDEDLDEEDDDLEDDDDLDDIDDDDEDDLEDDEDDTLDDDDSSEDDVQDDTIVVPDENV